jgi:hypothetical protein
MGMGEAGAGAWFAKPTGADMADIGLFLVNASVAPGLSVAIFPGDTGVLRSTGACVALMLATWLVAVVSFFTGAGGAPMDFGMAATDLFSSSTVTRT